MPYQTTKELPEGVRGALPEHAQEIFLAAFNSAAADGRDEESSMKIAWAAVKRAYRKNEQGEWEPTPAVAAGDMPCFFCDVSALLLGDLEGGLKRVPIAMVGRRVKGSMKFAITLQDIHDMRDNFRKRSAPLMVDYWHESEIKGPEGGDIPAAGWLCEVEDEPDADRIWWGQVEFTDHARARIQAKETRYMSPAVNWAGRDKKTGTPQGATLTSVALTGRPFFDEMPAIQLSDGWTPETQMEEKTQMEPTTVSLSDNGQMQVTCGECGKTTSAQIPKRLKLSDHDEPRVIRLSDVPEKNGLRDFTALLNDQANDQAAICIDVIRARCVQDAAVAAVDAAIAKGKFKPAKRAHFLKLALSDLDGFTAITADMQEVPLGERGIAGDASQIAASDQEKHNKRLNEAIAARRAAHGTETYGQAMKAILLTDHQLDEEHKRLWRE
jgi:cation transport regulator